MQKKTLKLLLRFFTAFLVLIFAAISIQLPSSVIEYQFPLTDVHNLTARGKYLCQNYVYLSPEIYVLSFVCVHKRFRDFIFDRRRKTFHTGSSECVLWRVLTIIPSIGRFIHYVFTVKVDNGRIRSVVKKTASKFVVVVDIDYSPYKKETHFLIENNYDK